MFQIIISVCFLKLATIDAANSGRLVHIATIVSQIIVCDIPNEVAIDSADLTITSAHNASHIDHRIIYKTDFQVDNFSVCSSASSSKIFIIQNVYERKIIKNSIRTSESQNVIIFFEAFDKITSLARKNNASDVSKVKGTSL